MNIKRQVEKDKSSSTELDSEVKMNCIIEEYTNKMTTEQLLQKFRDIPAITLKPSLKLPVSVFIQGDKEEPVIAEHTIIQDNLNLANPLYGEVLRFSLPKQQIIYDCKIFPYNDNTDEIIFAAASENNVYIYSYDTKRNTNENILCITDESKNEIFYSLEWSITNCNGSNDPIILVGGFNCIVRVYNINQNKEHCTLQGHQNEIYDIKTHPTMLHYVLTASKDHTVRLWNIDGISPYLLAIFHGPNGHLAEVISIAWHFSGKSFLSSGMDCSVKYWLVDEEILKNGIAKTNKDIKHIYFPEFSCDDMHDNFVDCCYILGNLFLSKSVYGDINLWRPNPEIYSKCTTIIKKFNYPYNNTLWYVRFAISHDSKMIAVCSDKGVIHIFDVFSVDNLLTASAPIQKLITHDQCLCRSIGFSTDSEYIIFGNEKGTICIAKRGKYNP